MKNVIAALSIGLALLAACKKDDADGTRDAGSAAGACLRERDSTCTPYGPDTVAAGKRMCQGFRWLDGASACPKENVLGTCVREGGRVRELMYGGPPNYFAPDVAEHVCARNSGMFLPASPR